MFAITTVSSAVSVAESSFNQGLDGKGSSITDLTYDSKSDLTGWEGAGLVAMLTLLAFSVLPVVPVMIYNSVKRCLCSEGKPVDGLEEAVVIEMETPESIEANEKQQMLEKEAVAKKEAAVKANFAEVKLIIRKESRMISKIRNHSSLFVRVVARFFYEFFNIVLFGAIRGLIDTGRKDITRQEVNDRIALRISSETDRLA